MHVEVAEENRLRVGGADRARSPLLRLATLRDDERRKLGAGD